MRDKTAILVVSFGTSHLDTLDRTITAIEQTIRREFSEATVRRAFTSGMIMKKLRERNQLDVDNVAQAMERLKEDGYRNILVQPTHIMNGDEYEKMIGLLEPFRQILQIQVGAPLLTGTADYEAVCSVLMVELKAPADDEAIVFMGHGTEHYANAAYCQLEYMLADLGWERALLGTVEGYPQFGQVLRKLKKQESITRVRLYPFMIVAGDHAKNDMAGPEAGSWKSRLEQEGYSVTCVLQGLGESPGVRQIFARHIRACMA